MARVLIVDDESAIRQTLRRILERQGYEVVEAATAGEALKVLSNTPLPEAALVDLLLPDRNGATILEAVVGRCLPTRVIMISGHGSIRTAVDAVREGAFDFIEKPMDRERLLITLRNAIRQASLLARSEERSLSVFPTVSPLVKALLTDAGRFASSFAPLLITGETGVGKEVLAKWIHDHSPQASGPFVALNCAALPENLAESELFGHVKGAFTGAATARKGKFLSADRGTLFLDEIGDLPLPVQAKLLRVLEEGKIEAVGSDKSVAVRARIIAATHRNLKAMAREGSFREDLLFRIAALPLALPPLARRPEDVPFLAQRFLDEARTRQGWPALPAPAGFISALKERSWPGNVRELRWAVERAALLAGPGLPMAAHLAPLENGRSAGADAGSLTEVREEAESRAIRDALTASSGNVASAARRLYMSRSRLYEKLSSFAIDPSVYRKSGKKG